MTDINTIQNKLNEIDQNRMLRKHSALNEYVQKQFPVAPKQTLVSLQKSIQILHTQLSNDPNNINLQNFINSLNDKIVKEDYAKEGSEDMAYYLAYKEHIKAFVWPTAEELEVRAIEDLLLQNLHNVYLQDSNAN